MPELKVKSVPGLSMASYSTYLDRFQAPVRHGTADQPPRTLFLDHTAAFDTQLPVDHGK